MTEPNPHRRIARILAFACYILAGLVLFASVFFILAGAMADKSELPNGATNQEMAILRGGVFVVIALMIVLFGWRVQRLFGQRLLQEKMAAKTAVGCLRLSSLGCGLWALLSAAITLVIGILPTGAPAGIQDVFVGASGYVLVITLMLSVAWFISKYFGSLNAEERRRIYQAYLKLIEPRLPGLADPETRSYVQEQTLDVLTKLDTTLKSNLLEDLGKSKLLTGNTRIVLSNADFRRVDLRLINLPEADLREINLEEANLEGAMLSRVNLHRARLKNANLSHARVQEANLQQADLTGAVLKETKLRGANLTETILREANLSYANLQGASLQQADLTGAVLTDTDLRGVDLATTIVTPEQLRQAKLSEEPA